MNPVLLIITKLLFKRLTITVTSVSFHFKEMYLFYLFLLPPTDCDLWYNQFPFCPAFSFPDNNLILAEFAFYLMNLLSIPDKGRQLWINAFLYCCWTSSSCHNLFPSNRMGKAQQSLCSWIAAIYWFVNEFSWRSLWSMRAQPLKIQPQLWAAIQ